MMNWKGLIKGIALMALAGGLTGCALFSGGGGDVAKPYICQSDVIHSGETLKISFLDTPSGDPLGGADKDFPVRTDGTINLPAVGSVVAAGKTYGALETEIQKLYVPKIYRQLTIVIKPGDRFYSVAGEVKNETRQLYLGETTVLRAISSCGGFNEYANRRKVKIIRGNGQTEIVDCRKAADNPKYDRPICPGDHIVVPRSL
ncbi:MAG TPA: polysaccharide biosynthesis/export family protein [Longimicrobiales bacterium]|nr:polysaccharide biosynthesis/export family protein [Longimicrobiales bacterium]